MYKETTIKYFKEEELEALFKILETSRIIAKDTSLYQYKIAVRNEAIFKLMYYCASRVSEITSLNIDNLNMLKNEIYCFREKGGINNTLRIINADVLSALKRHLRVNEPTTALFTDFRKNNRISRKTLHVHIKRYCEKANIPDESRWHCHALRHTRAIILANSRLDIREIQYWLGHADISSTQVYLQFTTTHQENLYRKLSKKK